MQPLFIYANSNYIPSMYIHFTSKHIYPFIHCIFCLFQETISTKRIRQQWWPRIMVSLMPHPLQNPTTAVQAAIIDSKPQQSTTTTVGSKPKQVKLFMFDPIKSDLIQKQVNLDTLMGMCDKFLIAIIGSKPQQSTTTV